MTSLQKQVDASHYDFNTYMTKARWASTWHQIDEVLATQPTSVLEVGPGAGMFAACARTYGLSVRTLDLDPELHPDYVAAADDIPLPDNSIDTACAFQVLEHMPYETSMGALAELCRVARKAVIISLPDVGSGWAETLTIPKLGTYRFILHNPFAKRISHTFDGEHHWEINKQGYALDEVIDRMKTEAAGYNLRTFRVHENLYHRFFVWTARE